MDAETERPPHATFTLDSGRLVTLDPDWRSRVRVASSTGYGSEAQVDRGHAAPWLELVDRRVLLAQRLLDLAGCPVAGADVLVVGASEGAECACLARRGARSVVGIDFGDVFEGDGRIGARRERIVKECGPLARQITFLRDDLTRSALENDRFDLVLSWQTLEHIADPAAAMRETHRLLRPRGTLFHEYNPFFALDGGHALCTLDFPWGHARLSHAEFSTYVHRFRADDAHAAVAFFTTALNRMTLADLRDHTAAAGLDITALVPRSRTEDLLHLKPDALEDVQRLYPRAEITDLVSRIVRLTARPRRHRL